MSKKKKNLWGDQIPDLSLDLKLHPNIVKLSAYNIIAQYLSWGYYSRVTSSQGWSLINAIWYGWTVFTFLQVERSIINLAGAKVQYTEDKQKTAAVSILLW